MKKFDRNVIFTFICFFILGSSGILINVFIVNFYNSDTLGKFNFLLSLIIIISQFTVLGVHNSVLKYNTQFQSDISSSSVVITSGLFIVFLWSIFIILFLIQISGYISKFFFKIKDIKLSFFIILPAIIFFSLNKVLLLALNGLNNIKAYASFNAMRFVFLLISIIIFYNLSFNTLYIGSVFVTAEFTLFLLLFIYVFKYINCFSIPEKKWIKKHISFGLRGMWGVALSEINTRIDILMIGYFLHEKSIGIYSFASMIGDGFGTLNYILRNNIEPVVGNAYFCKDSKTISQIIKNVRKRYIPFILILGLIIIFMYPVVFHYVFYINKIIIVNSWECVNILIGCYMISSFFLPFIGFLNLAGKPEIFSLIILSSIILNVILNYFFIPIIGIKGAALATGIVLIYQSLLLFYIGKKKIMRY